MTSINITASEANKPAETPAQPSQNPQQTQQPGDNQNQQQGAPDKHKPAQQKYPTPIYDRPGAMPRAFAFLAACGRW
jgi:hypothetical protein